MSLDYYSYEYDFSELDYMNNIFFDKFYGKDKFKEFVLMYENHTDDKQNEYTNGKYIVLNIFYFFIFLSYLLQSDKYYSKVYFIFTTLVVTRVGILMHLHIFFL